MISIYSSAFNLIKNNFDYKFHIENFCSIADEVVICVNSSDDNTLGALIELSYKETNLRIIESDYSYKDPLLDGKIKNKALQNTKNDIKIGLDMDEFIPLWQKNIWLGLAEQLIQDSCLCYMLPSINLYKDYNHYFSITPKWYMHKSGLYRGPVKNAIKKDGFINTKISDTCELINRSGDLVFSKIYRCDIEDLRTNNFPFVVHTGYLSLDNRLLRNKNFWSKHWLTESGGELPAHKIHEKMEDFVENYEKHELNL
jgi:hypothetical protein